MIEFVGEAHTDQPYTSLLARAMFSHAVHSAVDKFLSGSPERVEPSEIRGYTVTVQCLHTPGEASIPDTYDVTATLYMVGENPVPQENKRRWWRKGCKR